MTSTQFDVEKELQEYRKFAFDRNMVGVAIALILATTCQKVVDSLSNYFLMPIVNFCVTQTTSTTGTNWREMKIAVFPGLEIEIGLLGADFLEFLITTIVLYVIYFKVIKAITPVISNGSDSQKDKIDSGEQT